MQRFGRFQGAHQAFVLEFNVCFQLIPVRKPHCALGALVIANNWFQNRLPQNGFHAFLRSRGVVGSGERVEVCDQLLQLGSVKVSHMVLEDTGVNWVEISIFPRMATDLDMIDQFD